MALPADAAHQVLLLAHEVAQDTLADAQRLAAGVLAEAGRRADALVDEASDARARSAAQQAAASVAASVDGRHEDIVAMLAQLRDDLRDVSEALPRPRLPDAAMRGPADDAAHRESRRRRTSLLATDPDAVLGPSDEEFLGEVFRRISGVEPTPTLGPALFHPDDRVVAVRASAKRAAQRAAAERAAIQAEALERMAARRGAVRLANECGDVVVSMTDRRPAPVIPASSA